MWPGHLKTQVPSHELPLWVSGVLLLSGSGVSGGSLSYVTKKLRSLAGPWPTKEKMGWGGGVARADGQMSYVSGVESTGNTMDTRYKWSRLESCSQDCSVCGSSSLLYVTSEFSKGPFHSL